MLTSIEDAGIPPVVAFLAETPAGSGVYTGTLPPATMHGATEVRTKVRCFRALLPEAGPAAGGTHVTINGSGLSGATRVLFGSVAAPGLTVVSDSLIVAVSPPGRGTVAVTVVTPSGQSTADASGTYSYYAIESVTRTAGPSAGCCLR